MSFDLPIAERKLKNTQRLLHQGMWLLFLIAAALMVVVRRSAPARIGSFWILGAALLAFMVSFALRDVMRKLVRHNTEDRIVKDVKNFLEREPAAAVVYLAQPKPAAIRKARPAAEVPVKSAGFMELKGARFRTPAGDPVVFDAFPSREPVAFKTNLYPVLMPVLPRC